MRTRSGAAFMQRFDVPRAYGLSGGSRSDDIDEMDRGLDVI
jgi:hypothetical protein